MNFYKTCLYIVKALLVPVFRLKSVGEENIPEDGPVIIAVNHRSNLDPVIAGVTCPRQICFMAKEELFKNKLFGGLIKKLGAFPIKRGKGDVGAIKAAISIFKNNGAMLIFPEGRRVKDGKRRSAKPGVAMLAQRNQVPVIPVLIDGEYRWMSRITVRYGKPISFEEYSGQKLTGEELQTLADGVLDKIYKLGE